MGTTDEINRLRAAKRMAEEAYAQAREDLHAAELALEVVESADLRKRAREITYRRDPVPFAEAEIAAMICGKP